MWKSPQFSADTFTFTKEILNRKPNFLCSAKEKLSNVSIFRTCRKMHYTRKYIYFGTHDDETQSYTWNCGTWLIPGRMQCNFCLKISSIYYLLWYSTFWKLLWLHQKSPSPSPGMSWKVKSIKQTSYFHHQLSGLKKDGASYLRKIHIVTYIQYYMNMVFHAKNDINLSHFIKMVKTIFLGSWNVMQIS